MARGISDETLKEKEIRGNEYIACLGRNAKFKQKIDKFIRPKS